MTDSQSASAKMSVINTNFNNDVVNTNDDIVNPDRNEDVINDNGCSALKRMARVPSGEIDIFPTQTHFAPNDFQMKVYGDEWHIVTRICPLPCGNITVQTSYYFTGLPDISFKFYHCPAHIGNDKNTPNICTNHYMS